MPEHFLLRSQRNAVLRAIQEAGLNPAEFGWDTIYGDGTMISASVPLLTHRPTQSFYAFDYDAGRENHHAVYVPGAGRAQERIVAGDWTLQLAHVARWLENLKREYEAPDLWGELGRQREVVAGEPAEDERENTPFTPEEQAEITAQLRELKEYLRANHQLTGQQMRAIESRLDYLADAARRLGRFDWRQTLVGTLLGLVVQAVVPSEPIQDALALIGRGLGHLFGGGLGELPPA
jgi:hypothetical protein